MNVAMSSPENDVSVCMLVATIRKYHGSDTRQGTATQHRDVQD